MDYLISLLYGQQATSLRLQVNSDLMTFGDTLRDGERLASLMEHLPLIIHAKHLSFTFTGKVFNHKGQYFETNTSVTSSILGWKYT